MKSPFENIYPTKIEDVPENIKAFQDDVYGIGGLCKAVSELLSGYVEIVAFKTGKMEEGTGWVETGGFILTLDKRNGIPVVTLDGNGSLIASWYEKDASDPMRIVGTLAANYGSSLFRQKV